MEEILASSPDAVLESRKELITSLIAEENPIFRTAHFLKPSTTSTDESFTNLSSNRLPSIVPSSSSESRLWGLSIRFNGWRNPQMEWNNWVAKMVSLHKSTWMKAGVYEAILNSTYQIRRNNDLILGFAERWCPETSSFIFPWGEATITLEDMVVSGYSTLGSPVFSSLESANLRGIEERLIQAKKELRKTPSKQATHCEWTKKFMNSGSDIEHEAFLSMWLSRFVLPTTSSGVICACVFPIAILLSIGKRIALAPAVLASIYRDLRLLRERIDSLTIPETETRKTCQDLLVVQSPFQLVQVWIWERFIDLRPILKPIKCGETRLSRWDNVICKAENVRMVLASAATKDRFLWRPYAKTLKNWDFPKFYAENGMCVLVDSTLQDEWMTFVKCLRVSGLVGVDCVEKYLPHRVAMQFGYDQDLPGCVAQSILNAEMTWSDYTRPLGQVGLYIPPRAFEGGVTTRYKDWRQKSMLAESEPSNGKKNLFSTGASSSVLGFGPKTSSNTSLMTAKRKKPNALTAEKSPDAVLESRKELTTSPTAEEDPILRTAHFLKPSTDESFANLSSNLLPSIVPSSSSESRLWGLSIRFNGWRNPQLEWRNWVAKMVSLHKSTWMKAGVYEAILNSTYQIQRNNDLILGFAERWCYETSSFIFPWGEATITLEDMVVSGYSTLGSPVFSSLESANLREIEARLIQAKKELRKTPSKTARHYDWMNKFMNSGSDIEHEAFLSLWLSRFVLPTTSSDVVCACVFPIAILLSIGKRIALAPAVLASIYRDLRLLKENIDSLTISETETRKTSQDLWAVQSPFQLVQVWIWERFIELQPNPNPIKCGETRLSRWGNVKCKVENVRMVLASAATKDRFLWRPYAKTLENWEFPTFYAENGMCILVDSTLQDEWMTFVKCLRVSRLVGVDYCVQKYLPHRVAMQFGYDQDLPGCVAESTLSSEMAWSEYTRPLGEVGLYIPPRTYEGGVTTRYKDWWQKFMLAESELSNGKKNLFSAGASSSVLGFGPKTSRETSLMAGKRKRTDALTAEKSELIFRIKSEENPNLSEFSPCSSKIARKLSPGYLAEINNSPVSPGFPPKCNEAVVGDDSESAEEDNVTVVEVLNRRRRRGEAENSSGMVGAEVEKQVGIDGGTPSDQNAEKGDLQNLEGTLFEKARGGNAAATSEIERIWLRLEADVSWIEKNLI